MQSANQYNQLLSIACIGCHFVWLKGLLQNYACSFLPVECSLHSTRANDQRCPIKASRWISCMAMLMSCWGCRNFYHRKTFPLRHDPLVHHRGWVLIIRLDSPWGHTRSTLLEAWSTAVATVKFLDWAWASEWCKSGDVARAQTCWVSIADLVLAQRVGNPYM